MIFNRGFIFRSNVRGFIVVNILRVFFSNSILAFDKKINESKPRIHEIRVIEFCVNINVDIFGVLAVNQI